MNLHTRDEYLRQNHDPEKEKMKVLERCIRMQDPVLLSAEIERLRPANINALIPQCRIDEVLSIGSSLLRVPIANCLYDLIVVLLRHGANPLLPVNQTSDTYSGEDIRTISGLHNARLPSSRPIRVSLAPSRPASARTNAML